MDTHEAAIDKTTARIAVPKDWIPGLIENGKNDVVSGFIIFLIALPLCLGIALASGAPPIAGIISGFVAGMLASLLSGSHVTINGPAAGMIVIVLGAITELGAGDMARGFRLALAVGVIAGAIQIVLGLVRSGKMTAFFPLSVVHGMLAGIGLIIMSGQIHIALGLQNPREHGLHILTAIPPSFANLVPIPALIGLTSVLIMILWPMIKLGVAKVIPAPLIAVIIGTIIAALTGAGPLVKLPDSFLAGFSTPDFSQIMSVTSIKWIVLYVFVASLESLLTAEAVDKLDPWKRRSNMNRELMGKGAGNLVSSLIGGLPMIAEVVRSKANILQGARTRWSNFFHGFFLLVFVLLLPGVLQMIPLASLAGVLLVIGFKLAHPKDFLHALHIGKVAFALMFITAFTVLLTDLLLGVALGIVLGLIVAVIRGTSIGNLFKSDMEVVEQGDTITIRFRRTLGFHNFVGIRSKLDALPRGKNVVLDFSGVRLVDPTAMERLYDFEVEYRDAGGQVQRRGTDHLRGETEHAFAERTLLRTAEEKAR
ncbi:MAG: SulP family inorganic anion transporter [Acidobacteria bacterium]|nr:SulP family inorganic anion transporter [Acidobacteriota bacterium]